MPTPLIRMDIWHELAFDISSDALFVNAAYYWTLIDLDMI